MSCPTHASPPRANLPHHGGRDSRGQTVRYHWRDGTDLATVTETTDRCVAFSGPECNGRFTHEQIDRLIDDGRLQIVLGETRGDGRN